MILSQLTDDVKLAVRAIIFSIFTDLRSIPHPALTPVRLCVRLTICVPPFLLYQQTYVTEMCTKTLNEKPVDMSAGTGRELVGPRLSPRLSWPES